MTCAPTGVLSAAATFFFLFQGPSGDRPCPSAAQPVSGGNAEEAERMRNILGFVSSPTPRPQAGSSFQFGFVDDKAQRRGLEQVDTSNNNNNNNNKKSSSKNAEDLEVEVEGGDSASSVYAGGMPYFWTEEDIRLFWEECGAVRSVRCLTFGDSGRFRGIACVTFETQDGCNAALACDGDRCECPAQNGVSLHSFTVTVKKWQGTAPKPHAQTNEMTSKRHRAANVNKTPGYHVAFVCNIPYSLKEEDLYKLFWECGVEKVRLRTHRSTGASCGFAHIHFKDEKGLDSAMGLHGHQVDGRNLVVGYAKPPGEASKPPAGEKASISCQDDNVAQKDVATNGVDAVNGAGHKIPGYNVAFVSNVPYAASNLDLRRHFKGCQIERMIFLTHKMTSEFNGSIMIQFADEAALDRAVKMNGRQMTQPCSRELHVTYAKKKLKELMPGNTKRGMKNGEVRQDRKKARRAKEEEHKSSSGLNHEGGNASVKGSSKGSKGKKWTEEDDPLLALL